MKRISGGRKKYHVSDDVVAEFESAIPLQRVSPFSPTIARAVYLANRSIPPALNPLKNAGNGVDYLIVLMGLDFYRPLPHFLGQGKKYVYLFDAWPTNDDQSHDSVRLYSVTQLFVSSSIAAYRLSGTVKNCKVSWIPEGVDPSLYSARLYPERDIDVLQLGRKYEAHHEQIVGSLEKSAK